MTKYLIFRQTKKPLRQFAHVIKTDAVRFIYEPASALDVVKALLHISVSKTVCCGMLLAVSILLNSDYLNKFYHRYKAVRNA